MALAALLSSFALLAAGPSGLQLAQADTSPPASAEAPVTTSKITPDVQANADAVARGEDPFPSGAPTDDYGFMAWCYGALSGHVALYDTTLPEVRRIEAEFPEPGRTIDQVMADYDAQHHRGQELLESYSRVLDVEEAQGKTRGRHRATSIARGADVWKGSDTSNPRALAQLWMSWALPGRCQATAARLDPRASR